MSSSIFTYSYNNELKEIKNRILQKMIGSKDLNNINEILNLKNNYKISVTDNHNTNKLLDLITNILNTNDLDYLIQLEENLEKIELQGIQNEISSLQSAEDIYKQAHVDILTDFESADRSDLDKRDDIEIAKQDGINIYKLKGIPFNLMAHVGEYTAENVGNKQNNLHTTMITSEQKVQLIGGSKRFLIFNSINAENIKLMTTKDAYSASTEKDREQETKMLPDEFFANMGEDYNDYQLDTQNDTLQPNAIGVIGEITDQDIEYAKSRGISVIYSIDENCYYKESKENNDAKQELFNSLLEEYKKSFDPKLIAQLKRNNSYDRDEFLNIIKECIIELKESGNKGLVNANIDALKKVYRRELIGSDYMIERKEKLLNIFFDIEKLKESEDVIVNEGSIEEKAFLRLKNIMKLTESINKNERMEVYNIFYSILESSDDFDKDIDSIMSFVEQNCSKKNMACFDAILNACKNANRGRDNNPDILNRILETRSKAFESLQDRNSESSEISFHMLYSCFVEKTQNVDKTISEIFSINEKNAATQNGLTEKSLLDSGIEATIENTRIGMISDQENHMIQGLQQQKENGVNEYKQH